MNNFVHISYVPWFTRGSAYSDVIQNGSVTNDRAENSNCGMDSANKFDCHRPAPVQNPEQVQGSTSKEYAEDVGGVVSRNWECERQEKTGELAMCSHARQCWDHSCECGLTSNTEVCAKVSRRKWDITFDSMAYTSNRSTLASVQDPCLPVSHNCVPRKADMVYGGIR